MKNLNKILKHLRTFHKLTQQELGDKLGFSRSYICQVERGSKKQPSFELLNLYAKTFDIPVSVILLFAERWDEKGKAEVKLRLSYKALRFLDWINN
jgi:transcriptional regulator with XRE-family HTH domain